MLKGFFLTSGDLGKDYHSKDVRKTQSLKTFCERGGFDNPFQFPPFTKIPDALGECGDIEFAIFPPAN